MIFVFPFVDSKQGLDKARLDYRGFKWSKMIGYFQN